MMVDENDTENAKAQKKRKRNSNPLSQARGKQNNHENVWFRRSNAGYSLFVQYYMNQPLGTISSAEGIRNDGTHTLKQGKTILPKSGGGNSRAAKRRNKKKKGSTQNTNSEAVDETPVLPTTTESSVSSPLSLLESAYSKLEMTDQSPSHRNNFEFKSFLKAFSQPLPLSFRLRKLENVSERRKVDMEVAKEVLTELSDLVEAIQFGNTTLYRSKSRQSRPGEILCKENLSKISPDLKEFLVEYSQNGVLARQEIGSMLPVIALHDVGALQAGAKVLDVCASPGSKTLQALEIVGQKGRVVANDVSENRLLTLRQALERSGVSSNLMKRIHFSCQDGSKLEPPVIKSKSSGESSQLQFSCVIADVPCSGDGTCRKDKHILPMWKPNCGNDLHDLQLRILMRALQVVEVGGVVCYSTCTLNPIEDEAVVAAALSKIQASTGSTNDAPKKKRSRPVVELIDWPSLPGDLVRRNGISTWKVAEFREDEQQNQNSEDDSDDEEDIPNITWHDSYSSAISRQPTCTISPTMWPPSKEIAKELHLEKCIRLWPHDRDTGGFFLALLKKNRDFTIKNKN